MVRAAGEVTAINLEGKECGGGGRRKEEPVQMTLQNTE